MSKGPNPIPEGKTDAQLAGEFASFFLNKIEKIRLQFQNTDQYIPEVNTSVPRLCELQPLTDEEIEKEICSMNNKTCELETIPTYLIKDILPAESQKLSFGVPQGLCSGVNIFTCYCSLINKQVPESISINGFADDHSLQKTFKAGNKQQETTTKQLLDKMQLKLNSKKT